MSIPVKLGTPAPLVYTAPDGSGAKFPRADVFDFPGGAPIAGSPFPLVHVGGGTYAVGAALPTTGVYFMVNIVSYDDGGFATPTPGVPVVQEVLAVQDPVVLKVGGTLDRTVNPARFRVNAWLEREGVVVTAGLASGSLDLYDKDGATLLGGPIAAASADAQGAFLFEFDEPGFGIGQTQAYFHVSMTENLVPRSGMSSLSVLRRA